MEFTDKLQALLSRFPPSEAHHIFRYYADQIEAELGKQVRPRINKLANSVLDQPLDIGDLLQVKNNEPLFLGKYTLVEDYEALKLRGSNSSLPDYQFLRVKYSDNYFFLEIIGFDLLQDRGFGTYKEWETYLKKLHTNGIVEIEEQHEINKQAVIVYRISAGYMLLDSKLSNNMFFNKVSIAMRLMHNINTACRGTIFLKNDSTYPKRFSFVTAHSHFILVNDSLNIKLVAIGGSLNVRAQYLSASRHNKESYPHGIGLSAYSFFMGMLLFELLTDQSPIYFLNKVEGSNQKFLTDSPLLNDYPKQIHAFIKRSTHKIEANRYPSMDRMAEDIDHIRTYLNYCEENVLIDSEKKVVEFIEFLSLRFKAHMLNPKLHNSPVSASTRWLVKYIANDFAMFFKDNNDLYCLYNAMIHNNGNAEDNFPLNYYKQGTPLSEFLFKYYQFWSSILVVWDKRPKANRRAEVDFIGIIFLLYILEYEIIAFTQSLARQVIHNLQNSAYISSLPTIKKNYKYLVELSPESNLYSDFSFASHAIDHLKSWLSRLNPESVKKIHVAGEFESFEITAIFVLLAGGSLAIFDEVGNQVFPKQESSNHLSDPKSYLEAGNVILAYHNRLCNIFPKGDQPINSVQVENQDSEEWRNFTEQVLKIVWDLNPARRVNATLKYKASIIPDRKGQIIYRRFFKNHSTDISEHDLIHRDDISRTTKDSPVKVDLISKGPNQIGTVMVKPLLNFPVLPISPQVNKVKHAQKISHNILLALWSKRKIILPVGGIIAFLVPTFLAIVSLQPIADMTASPKCGQVPLTVQFNNESTNAQNFEWNFGDKEVSNEQDPIHVFAQPGEYIVTLQVSRNLSSLTSISKQIELQDETAVKISVVSEQENCSNTSQGEK